MLPKILRTIEIVFSLAEAEAAHCLLIVKEVF